MTSLQLLEECRRKHQALRGKRKVKLRHAVGRGENARYEAHFHQGNVIWCALVMANQALYQPGPTDLPCFVVYSFDPWFDNFPHALVKIAAAVGTLKGTTHRDAELNAFAAVVTNERARCIDREVPLPLTHGRHVRYDTLWIERDRLPASLLIERMLPIIADPVDPTTIMLLPLNRWPEALVASSLATAGSVLGDVPQADAFSVETSAVIRCSACRKPSKPNLIFCPRCGRRRDGSVDRNSVRRASAAGTIKWIGAVAAALAITCISLFFDFYGHALNVSAQSDQTKVPADSYAKSPSAVAPSSNADLQQNRPTSPGLANVGTAYPSQSSSLQALAAMLNAHNVHQMRGMNAATAMTNFSPPNQALPDDGSLAKTRMIGGTEGGAPYLRFNSQHRLITGFQIEMAEWFGKSIVRNLGIIYQGDTPANSSDVYNARPGYVLGGLTINGDDHITAMRIRFTSYANGHFNNDDSYETDWIGEPNANATNQLAGNGEEIVGIFGRKGLNVDALGLVTLSPGH